MKPQSILLIEDDPFDEMMTIRALASLNLANPIQVAHDGAEALEMLSNTISGDEPSPPPAVVLLDLKLPKIGGLDVLRAIRSNPRTRMTPVVILTSSNEKEDLLGSYSSGANSYVCKPVDAEAFRKAVTTLGLYWIMINEQPPKI